MIKIKLLVIGIVLLGFSAQSQTVVRGPYLQTGTPTSIIVKWRTDISTFSEVRFGNAPNNLNSFSVDSTTLTTEHEIILTGLSSDTKYYYSIGIVDSILNGNDSSHFFITSPANNIAKPTRIWVIGDSGTKDNGARSVRDSYYSYTGNRYTDVWLMLGDNAYYSGTDAEYQAAVFENMYERILKQTVLWTTPGNHDYLSGASAATQTGTYYDIFSLPRFGEAGGLASGTEAYYSFDYGTIHFISMDSHDSPLDSLGSMMTWAKNDIAATDKDWIIAFWHYPPYSRGSHDSDVENNSIQMRENALPFLEAAGVDLVLSGHSHNYERSFLLDGHYGFANSMTVEMLVDSGNGRVGGDCAYQKSTLGSKANKGAVYIVAGSSGWNQGGGTFDHPAMFVSYNLTGSLVIDVDQNRMDVTFINNASTVLDYFTLLKETETIVDMSICQGDSILLGGVYQTTTGNYYDTLPGRIVCDSIIVTNLIVNPIYNITLSESICSGDSLFLQGAYQTIGATYYDTLSSVCAADSIITTVLLVNPVYEIIQSVSICSGDSIFLQGIYQTISGTYHDTLSTICIADSIITTSLIVNPIYIITLSESICSGDSLFLQGAYQTIGATYYDTLSSICVADSIIITTLQINSVYSTIQPVGICSGDSLFLQGAYQIVSGTYYDTLSSTCLADGIITTILSINTEFSNQEFQTICEGDSVFLIGSYQTIAGTYYDSLLTVEGCDSLVITSLIVDPNYYLSQTSSICFGDSILLAGSYQTTAGLFYDSLITIKGCDSVNQTTLIVNLIDTVILLEMDTLKAAQSGANYQWLNCATDNIIQGESDQFFSPSVSGTYTVIITLNGCVDTATCYYVGLINIIENTFGNALKVYPNPAKNNLTVDLGSPYEDITFKILNTNGQEVYRNNNTHPQTNVINITSLATGTYMLHIFTAHKTAILYFIKE
ncbi:MAG: metallophosphoesterase [Flavobacteriales bacterium]|nr:metallophosphoesterase [Flavobacteriales bacterium]